MSGGHFNYAFYHLDEYSGHMEDAELNMLLEDFGNLLHDLEWYKSGDYGPDQYREAVAAFKKKWLKGGANRTDRLKQIIEEKTEQLRKELTDML